MTVTPQPNCAIISVAAAMPGAWCTYEVWAHDPDTGEASLIFINYTSLKDVVMLIDLNRNTRWQEMSKRGTWVTLKIIATGPRDEIRSHATAHLLAHNPRPECNTYGYALGGKRRIKCSNGVVYETQQAAAAALGISQSAISQQMRGRIAAVKGYTFAPSKD